MDQHIKIVSKTGTKVKMAFHFLTVTEERIKRVYEHCSCDCFCNFYIVISERLKIMHAVFIILHT